MVRGDGAVGSNQGAACRRTFEQHRNEATHVSRIPCQSVLRRMERMILLRLTSNCAGAGWGLGVGFSGNRWFPCGLHMTFV